MSHDTRIADMPVAFLRMDALARSPDSDSSVLDLDDATRAQLQDLSSSVTLGLVYDGSLTQARSALQAAGLYHLFGDMTLARSCDEIPGILRSLNRSSAQGCTFLVGSHEDYQLWPGDLTYVPDLSLLYGSLAGQDIVVASLLCKGNASTAALVRLLRSSIIPVFRDPVDGGQRFIAYLCEGSLTHLEAAGLEVTELANTRLIDATDLYLQQLPFDPRGATAGRPVFANNHFRILAMSPPEFRMLKSIGNDRVLKQLRPDTRLFSHLQEIN